MTSISSLSSFAARPGARQFVKFCIVGASSALIDFGLLFFLHFSIGLPVAISATLSFFTALCNGFYWNRRWTFQGRTGNAGAQYRKFVLSNIIGWLLNLGIMTGVLILAGTLGVMHTQRSPQEIVQIIASGPAAGQAKHEFNGLTLLGAKAVATVIVTAWNFTASKFWTFKS